MKTDLETLNQKFEITKIEVERIKTEFEKHLNQIGWSIGGCNQRNCYIYDHNNKRTGWQVLSDHISYHLEKNVYIYFNFIDCKSEVLKDGDAVSLLGKTNEDIFILFQNFDKPKE